MPGRNHIVLSGPLSQQNFGKLHRTNTYEPGYRPHIPKSTSNSKANLTMARAQAVQYSESLLTCNSSKDASNVRFDDTCWLHMPWRAASSLPEADWHDLTNAELAGMNQAPSIIVFWDDAMLFPFKSAVLDSAT